MAISFGALARSSWRRTLPSLSIIGRSLWSGKVSIKSNHSKVLSRADGHVYELQGEGLRNSYVLCSLPISPLYAVAHVVKPECTEEYLKEAYDMTVSC